MKRLTMIVTVLLVIAFAVAALGDMVGMANPWTDLDSIDALNEAVDANLHLPEGIDESKTVYRLLDTDEDSIAEIQFVWNNLPCTLRFSGIIEKDVSGVYLEDGHTAFEGKETENDAIIVRTDMKLARWLDIGGQYVLMVEDKGQMTEEAFSAFAAEMKKLCQYNPFLVMPEGTYVDSTSQRAFAELRQLSGDTYAIEIHWANDAKEDMVWKMTTRMMEDGLMEYNDCVKTRVVTEDDGSQKSYEANLIPDGYFVGMEKAFDWSGAAEEACRDCLFVLEE